MKTKTKYILGGLAVLTFVLGIAVGKHTSFQGKMVSIKKSAKQETLMQKKNPDRFKFAPSPKQTPGAESAPAPLVAMNDALTVRAIPKNEVRYADVGNGQQALVMGAFEFGAVGSLMEVFNLSFDSAVDGDVTSLYFSPIRFGVNGMQVQDPSLSQVGPFAPGNNWNNSNSTFNWQRLIGAQHTIFTVSPGERILVYVYAVLSPGTNPVDARVTLFADPNVEGAEIQFQKMGVPPTVTEATAGLLDRQNRPYAGVIVNGQPKISTRWEVTLSPGNPQLNQ